MSLPHRQAIAAKVRKKAELYRVSTDAYYRFDKNLREMCAICAVALSRSFVAAGYQARSFFGTFFDPNGDPHSHCWTMLEVSHQEEVIVERWDITATQFGKRFSFPKVMVVFGDTDHYDESVMIPDLADLHFWYKWPFHQRPTEEILQRLEVKHEPRQRQQARRQKDTHQELHQNKACEIVSQGKRQAAKTTIR